MFVMIPGRNSPPDCDRVDLVMTRPLRVGVALFLVGAMCLAVYERGAGCQWSPRQRTRFAMHNVSEAVVQYR